MYLQAVWRRGTNLNEFGVSTSLTKWSWVRRHVLGGEKDLRPQEMMKWGTNVLMGHFRLSEILFLDWRNLGDLERVPR